MKTSFPRSSMFRVAVCLSCLTAGADVGFAQQSQYAQRPQYASTYYPPQQPSAMDRIRNTGQNVGNFIRRKFYGEPAPTSYPPPPVYRRPGGSYQTQSYNLDAPARPVQSSSGTGFQRPAPGSTPKYVTPPTSTPTESKASSATSTKTATKTKSSPPPTVAPAPAPTASKKRYTPAKPSTFSKSKPKATSEPKRVMDEPPATPSSTLTPPTVPEPPKYESTPPVEPTTEAKLNKEFYPLPGSPEPAPTADTAGISPTIGGAEPDQTPKSTEPTVTTTSTSTTTDVGSKSSGSFLVGKKTSKAGRVVSPYAPFNELDITGLPSGSLALDPTTQKVFEVP